MKILFIILCSVLIAGCDSSFDYASHLWVKKALSGNSYESRNGNEREGTLEFTDISQRQRIIIVDQRETALFGVLKGGGWRIEGSVLDSVEESGVIYYLYIKKIYRWKAGFWDNHINKNDSILVFLLVKRAIGSMLGEQLAHWEGLAYCRKDGANSESIVTHQEIDIKMVFSSDAREIQISILTPCKAITANVPITN